MTNAANAERHNREIVEYLADVLRNPQAVETLDGMVEGDSTIGNGEPWTPEIKVKGGNSAFYCSGAAFMVGVALRKGHGRNASIS